MGIVSPCLIYNENSVSYWNDEVHSLKIKALIWHDFRQQCDKPRDGVVAHIMRRARHKYHYTLRSIKKNDTMLRKFTTWNKAIRRIWNLPTHSHKVLLRGLNEGKHVSDYAFKRLIKMYNIMKCKNIKKIYVILLAKNDKRSIISNKLQFICETANTKGSEYNSHILYPDP